MEWITRQEAARRLGIGLRTLDGLVGRGEIPAYRVGSKLVRIKDVDLDKYMAARLVEPEKVVRRGTVTIERPCLYVPGMKVV